VRVEVVVGLDSGTTATKAVTAGADGRVRDVVSVGYPLLVPAPGRAELDAARVREAAVEALTAIAARARERGDEVAGVALSAAMHGLVPLDDSGAPTGPLITWADGRAGAQADALREQGRAADLHARTGTPVHPMSPLCKLAWLREHDEATLRETPRWGGVKELVLGALCGAEHVVDLSCASATGMYDLAGGRWDDEAVEIAGARLDQLPEVRPTTSIDRGLGDDVAATAGLRRDLPVVLGASDGVLANLGIGAVQRGVAAVSLGTSAAMRAVVDRPTVDPSGRLFCYALTDDRWVLGGAVNNGGSVVRWAGLALAGVPGAEAPEGEDADALDAELLEEAASVPPGSEGLLCLPYLLGERAPWWRAGMRGAYIGLRREHRRAHLVRAAVEGVCQQLALVRGAFPAADLEVREVRATGGAVASSLWTSVLASALDLPVRVADSPEGTALGACLLGLHALDRLPDLDDAARLVEVREPVEPDPEDAELYRRTRPLVEKTTLALADVFAELDALSPDLAGPAEAV
jgi:gluconokinase